MNNVIKKSISNNFTYRKSAYSFRDIDTKNLFQPFRETALYRNTKPSIHRNEQDFQECFLMSVEEGGFMFIIYRTVPISENRSTACFWHQFFFSRFYTTAIPLGPYPFLKKNLLVSNTARRISCQS